MKVLPYCLRSEDRVAQKIQVNPRQSAIHKLFFLMVRLLAGASIGHDKSSWMSSSRDPELKYPRVLRHSRKS